VNNLRKPTFGAIWQHFVGRKTSMRWLSLCMVSHGVLLRAPGPLGVYAIRQSEAQVRQMVRQTVMQRAIVKSAFALGVIGPDEYRKHLQ
jgi:hypothetical protein